MSRPPLHIAITYQPKSMPEQKPPLWEVMHKAHSDVGDPFGNAVLAAYAAEIRALRDWLVPEEDPLPDSVHGGNRFARQAERQRLRALLTAEADRAKRGRWSDG